MGKSTSRGVPAFAGRLRGVVLSTPEFRTGGSCEWSRCFATQGSGFLTMSNVAIDRADIAGKGTGSLDDPSATEGVAASVQASLSVNGVTHSLRLEPRMTLAEALRGPLNLTGTKIACNRGACSACTVWLDGLPILSCMTLALDVGERKVVTIEGLAKGEALHKVQQAFIDHDAVQCGFCTPGLVMSCAALLERNAEPSEEHVREAISGHICRCGAFPHVIAAVLDAATK